MRVINQAVEEVPVGAVQPHPMNPREGDVGAIWESIEENGFYGAIVVQRSTGNILVGNHRYWAAKEAGAESIPAIYVDVDDDRAERILLADNRTNDLASYDNEVLAELLQEKARTPDAFAGTGYDGDALDQILDDLERPTDGEWADAFDDVPEGERAPFQQKTFTLHDEQAEIVDAALRKAKDEAGGFDHTPNENSNGNALAHVCEAYLNG